MERHKTCQVRGGSSLDSLLLSFGHRTFQDEAKILFPRRQGTASHISSRGTHPSGLLTLSYCLPQVIAHELNQSLTSLRVANIYDLSTKILLFKFAKPDTKKQLLIDIGFRCHTTEFARATAGTPSAFVSRLRKVLKTRRLTSVSQIGTDRILEFQFSDGQYRLFLEFFAVRRPTDLSRCSATD